MDARVALSSLLVSAVVVVAYHLVVSSGSAEPSDPGPDPAVARLATRVQALEDATGAEPSLGGGDVDDRLALVERRLADLEAREEPAPIGSASPESRIPSEDAAARARSTLEAARDEARQASLERTATQYRDRIRRLDPRAADDDLAAAAILLAEYTLALRELHRGSSNATPAERDAVRQRHDELRRALQGKLRGHLSDGAVDALTQDVARNR